jgi:DNA-binding CsgD family transcriptional regulator
VNTYLNILRSGAADVSESASPHEAIMPSMLAVPGVGDLAQSTSLADVHRHLNVVTAALGLPTWFVQVEDCRTLARPHRYTFSNHRAARAGSDEVAGADALPEFAEQIRQFNETLVANESQRGVPVVWPQSGRCPLGHGFSMVSVLPTSKACVGFARPHQGRQQQPLTARQLGNDYAPFVVLIHHVMLPILAQRFVSSQAAPESERELECLYWVARGKTASETAMLLQISEHTVNFHIQRIIGKLNASNRSHAVAIAVAMGLIGVVTST